MAGEKQADTAKDAIPFFSGERKVSLELPTLKLSKMADKMSDDIAVLALFANLTDLEEAEIMNLPLPDYRSLVSAASHFLTKTSGLLSVKSVETILDIAPLAGYCATDALEWTTEIALRRYELALAHLGEAWIKNTTWHHHKRTTGGRWVQNTRKCATRVNQHTKANPETI